MPNTAAIPAKNTDDLSRWKNPALILAVAVLLGHAPLALLHLQGLWQQEQYQYFPFVIAAIGAMLWMRWQETPATSLAPKRWASLHLWFASASLALLASSILVVSPWLAFVSLNLGLAAVFVLIYRQRCIPYLGGIWLLLWLLVPMPLGVDNRLVQTLQKFSSQLSSTLLNLIGILHLMTGNVLKLPGKEFFVDEACSGIISVMSMIACAAIYAVWKNRNFLHLIFLVLAGVVWALILNVLRIFLIAFVFHYFDFDLSSGLIHDALGLSLFLLMFLSLVSTDHLLMTLLAPIDAVQLGETGRKNWLVQQWNRITQTKLNPKDDSRVSSNQASARLSRIVGWAVPFLLLGALQLVWLPSPNSDQATLAIEQALALDEQSMPLKIGPWTRESFEAVEREAKSDFGKYSRSYRYRHNQKKDVVATVSLDFPYLGGWHDLCMCYRNSGWTINNRSIELCSLPEAGTPWGFVEGSLENATKEKAYVAFAGFYVEGSAAAPPSDAVLFRPWFRLRRRLLHNTSPQLLQVQAFSTGASSTNPEMQKDLQQLLFQSRTQFHDRIIESKNP